PPSCATTSVASLSLARALRICLSCSTTAQMTTSTRIVASRATVPSRGLYSANAKYGPTNHTSNASSTRPSRTRNVRLFRKASISAHPAMNDFHTAVARAVLRLIDRLIARLERALPRGLDARAIRHRAADQLRDVRCAGARELVVVLEAEGAQRLVVRMADHQHAPRHAIQRATHFVEQRVVAVVHARTARGEQVGRGHRDERALPGLLHR